MNRKKHPRGKPYSGKARSYISYETILAAKSGDVLALKTIAATFRPMIRSMAVRTRYDDDNIPRQFVDDYICQQVENELLRAIMYNLDLKEAR